MERICNESSSQRIKRHQNFIDKKRDFRSFVSRGKVRGRRSASNSKQVAIPLKRRPSQEAKSGRRKRRRPDCPLHQQPAPTTEAENEAEKAVFLSNLRDFQVFNDCVLSHERFKPNMSALIFKKIDIIISFIQYINSCLFSVLMIILLILLVVE